MSSTKTMRRWHCRMYLKSAVTLHRCGGDFAAVAAAPGHRYGGHIEHCGSDTGDLDHQHVLKERCCGEPRLIMAARGIEPVESILNDFVDRGTIQVRLAVPDAATETLPTRSATTSSDDFVTQTCHLGHRRSFRPSGLLPQFALRATTDGELP